MEESALQKSNAYLQHWKSHRSVLPDLVSTITDEKLSFQPWNGAQAFSDLVWHIVTSNHHLISTASGQPTPRPEKPEILSVAQLQEIVREYTKGSEEAILSMSDAQFDEIIDMTQSFGFKLPAHALLASALDHEIHHKGQLFIYARMCGATETPFFIHRG